MNKTITVFDYLNRNNLTVSIDELEFRVSVYGLLIEDKKILIQVSPKLKTYNLPGGKIEKGELIYNTLIREFKEETGLIVKPSRLFRVKESFVRLENKTSYHSILIFYLVERAGGELGMIDHTVGDSENAIFASLEEKLIQDMEPVFVDVIKQSLEK